MKQNLILNAGDTYLDKDGVPYYITDSGDTSYPYVYITNLQQHLTQRWAKQDAKEFIKKLTPCDIGWQAIKKED